MRQRSRLTRRRSTLSQCCCSVSNSPTYTPPLFLHVTSLSLSLTRTCLLFPSRNFSFMASHKAEGVCVYMFVCVYLCVCVCVCGCVCDGAEDVLIKRIDLAICNTSSGIMRRLTLMEEATAETWLAIYRHSALSANTHTFTHTWECANRNPPARLWQTLCTLSVCAAKWTRSHQSLRNLLKLSVPVL